MFLPQAARGLCPFLGHSGGAHRPSARNLTHIMAIAAHPRTESDIWAIVWIQKKQHIQVGCGLTSFSPSFSQLETEKEAEGN